MISERSEKGRLLPQVLREKAVMKHRLEALRHNVALYVGHGKLMEQMRVKQLRDATEDLARFQRKLNAQIKGKR